MHDQFASFQACTSILAKLGIVDLCSVSIAGGVAVPAIGALMPIRIEPAPSAEILNLKAELATALDLAERRGQIIGELIAELHRRG